jgi:phosphoglycerate kinase
MTPTLDDLQLRDQFVLVRVDFNVPLNVSAERTSVGDDTRIRAALPTIRYILGKGGHPILMSHLGRPKGKWSDDLSLAPIAAHLRNVLDRPVTLAAPPYDPVAVHELFREYDVVLLENTRFDPREELNDASLARELGELGTVFVNDAFGAAHRAHASTEGIAHVVRQKAAGLLMAREINVLEQLLGKAARPFIAIIGGAKVSDKIGIVESLLPKVDRVLVGGAMAYTFLKAQGVGVGRSLVEDDRLEVARDLLQRADGKLGLPVDHVAATEFAADADSVVVDVVPAGRMGLDIGPQTIELYDAEIRTAATVVWNGPMGVFEMPRFANGTLSIAAAVAAATEAGAFTVVGGGDSVAAISEAGFDDDVSHVSTGGGAMLEYLEGITLPGIAALAS